VTDRGIGLVLDTSAVMAFGKGSIHVGETIAEVDANGDAFGVPLACLAEASTTTTMEWLELLARHPACSLLVVEVGEWRQLAAMRGVAGRGDAAAALLAANNHDCYVLTGEPDLYAELGDDPPVIVI